MGKYITLACFGIMLLGIAPCCATNRASSAPGGLITPPAISIPYGGKVVTEINFSQSDVLGVIKQIIPALGDLMTNFAPKAAAEAKNPIEARAMTVLKGVDFQAFADAIQGITNIRLLVVKYGAIPKVTDLESQLDYGVAKLGKFSRVLSDISMFPGLVRMYAQADGGGYVGYAFNSKSRVLYAARVLGSADIPKLIKWVADLVKTTLNVTSPTPEPVPEQPESAEPATTPTEAPQPEKS
ncbi:MAG: hypothetical protein N3B12_05455 [Armatimonadetes bacterium]|nr:hypothetical protein [Armatimonadota bacterium]